MKIIFVFIYIFSFLLVIPLGFWVYRSKRKLWKSIMSGCLLLALLSSIFVYQQHQNLTSITSDKLLSKTQVVFTRADFEGSMVVQSIKADDAIPLWRQSFKINKGSEVSATLHSNTVFLLWIDQNGNDLIFSALRVADGKELWRHVLGSGKSLRVPTQLKPVVIQDMVYIGINEIGSQGTLANNRFKGGILSAYRVSDGRNLWNRHLPPIGTSISLPTSRNLIVLATEYEQLYVTVMDVGLLALRASDGSEIWRSNSQTIMQIGNGIVYQVGFGGKNVAFTSVTAHRGSDGKDLWTQYFEQIESITMGTNHLYVTNFIYDGDKSKTFFYALDINTGKILWKNQIRDSYAHFVLSNGIIYMTDVWNLEAIRETDGTLIWMKKTTDTYFQFAYLVLYRDVLFVTTSQVGTEGFFCLVSCPVTQRIYAIAAKDGSVKWEYHPSVVSDSEGFIQIGTN